MDNLAEEIADVGSEQYDRLESALRINAMGAKNVLDAARKAGARLCHVSTCYVAGKRDGDVW